HPAAGRQSLADLFGAALQPLQRAEDGMGENLTYQGAIAIGVEDADHLLHPGQGPGVVWGQRRIRKAGLQIARDRRGFIEGKIPVDQDRNAAEGSEPPKTFRKLGLKGIDLLVGEAKALLREQQPDDSRVDAEAVTQKLHGTVGHGPLHHRGAGSAISEGRDMAGPWRRKIVHGGFPRCWCQLGSIVAKENSGSCGLLTKPSGHPLTRLGGERSGKWSALRKSPILFAW